MASKDVGSKDNLDFYDEELDYGDLDDLDAELLGPDLVAGDVAYDEFDLDADELDPDFAPQSTNTTTSTSDVKEGTGDPAPNSELESSTSSPSTSHNAHALPSKPSVDNKDAKSEEQSPASNDGASCGSNRSSVRPPYGSPTRGGMGRGYGGRGRGQPYMGGMGRGSFDNRQGAMMGMGMNGMNMNPMNMGMMGMNMGLGMGIGGTQYPYDGYSNPGNRNMAYYGGPNGMDGNMAQGMNRMNQNMGGMNARPGSMAGRNIHINPKFQNLASISNISAAITPTGGFTPNPNAGVGAKSATWDNNRSSMSPVRSTRPGTENNGDYQRDRQSTRDNSARLDERTSNFDRDKRSDSYNSHSRSDRDGSLRSSDRGSNDRSRHESSHGHSDSKYLDSPGRNSDSRRRDSRSRSPLGRPATVPSINSRLSLGAKRGNDAMNSDVSNKSQKSNDANTPRSSKEEPESVSFLRGRHDRPSGEDTKDSNAAPTGFVRMDNVPESTSDSVIRALADGVSGVDRILVRILHMLYLLNI
ncbi:hypothetical protein BGZ93_008973 [Podila epicladia]|nr:hypothetical protein BGZ92_004430 [Podila epicladia]KAG0091134.1 hypothetical protein BGZ93_008973 [Podila epicladia]